MVAQECDEKIRGSVLEDKTQSESGPSLKQLVAEFANANAAVGVWAAEAFNELTQSQHAFCSFARGQFPQPSQHTRVDGEKLSQSTC